MSAIELPFLSLSGYHFTEDDLLRYPSGWHARDEAGEVESPLEACYGRGALLFLGLLAQVASR